MIQSISMLLLVGMLCSVAQARPGPWHIWSDPLELTRHRDDYTVVEVSSFSAEPCEYGIDGHVASGAAAQACRYDHLWESRGRDRFLRIEGDERVLLDERGAGALVRLWMTTGQGVSADFPEGARLRVRLDGDPVPYLDLALAHDLDGTVPPFAWPLAGDRQLAAGATYSYVPIVFHSRLTVSVVWPVGLPPADDLPLWYQFHVARLAGAPDEPPGVVADVDDLLEFSLHEPGAYPWPQALPWQSGEIEVGEGDAILFDHDRPDVLLALRLRPRQLADWQQLEIEIAFDGDARLRMPLAELFALRAPSDGVAQSLLWGIDDDGYGYLFLPMPFHRNARLLLRRSESAAPAIVDYEIALSGSAPAPDSLRLLARTHDACEAGSRLAPDLALLALDGRGRWLGLHSRQSNLPGSDHIGGPGNFLEGDERIHVDGSAHPRWHGTGNEDFYNGGFYFDRGGSYGFAHAFAFSGAPSHSLAGPDVVASSLYRVMPLDALPFHSRLDVRLERGAYGDQPMCAKGVGFAYFEPQPALRSVASLDLGEAADVAAAQYQPPVDSSCGSLLAAFVDEPPSWLAATVCAFEGGESTFRFVLDHPAGRLWLRRRFDSATGAQAGTIEVGGNVVGHLPFATRQPSRRWQEVDVPLDLPPQPAGTVLEFRVRPEDPTAPFTESAYVLLSDLGDAAFSDGFESPR